MTTSYFKRSPIPVLFGQCQKAKMMLKGGLTTSDRDELTMNKLTTNQITPIS